MFLASRVAYWLRLVHLWELDQILVDPSVCLVSLMAYLVTNPPEVRKRVIEYHVMAVNGKGKATPIQAKTGPWGQEVEASRILRQLAYKGGKVVSRTHRTQLPQGDVPGTHFC